MSIIVPEGNFLHTEGVVIDACGGESDSEHILGCGDEVWGRNTVQICHIAKKKSNILQCKISELCDCDKVP